ncbi:MAG: D-2-hydroxyacid dehydrogenase [Deltaproteobacteria bacterium]|nr:D-2-hydroxyacid dehydrogenase [Deltaproteobacteria bacterium]
MTSAERVVVHLAYPGLEKLVDVARVSALDPRIETVLCPYMDDMDLRTAKRLQPASRELRARAPKLTPEQSAAFARAEILLGLDAPFDVAEVAPGLRWIQAMGSGVGQFAASRLRESGILLTNAAGVGAPSIAEFVIGRILAIWKDFAALDALQRERRWTRHQGRLLSGATIGIVGLGAIGAAVARRAKAFDLRVIANRRSWRPGATAPCVDELLGPDRLHELLGRSDVVVLAAAGTPETENLMNAAAFHAMKPGSVFINVARGNMVDEKALAEALRSEHLSAAATDVALEEPLPPESPLWDVPNLLISPHSSASQDRYFEMIFEIFLANLEAYLAGRPLANLCDLAKGY